MSFCRNARRLDRRRTDGRTDADSKTVFIVRLHSHLQWHGKNYTFSRSIIISVKWLHDAGIEALGLRS